jgi:hypothetical protein
MRRLLILPALAIVLTACEPKTIEYVCAPNPKHSQEFYNRAADQLDAIKVTSPELVILLNERDNFGEAAKRCAAAMRGKKKAKR